MNGRLNILEGLPAQLLERPAERLAEALEGPTLLTVDGEIGPPLFVSVLLHGNEASGWNGLRRLLLEPGPLARSLIVFIGNVSAAAAGLRSLPNQPDFNRIWRGADSHEGELARELLRRLRCVPLFAAIDLHNNTGHNPHYGVVTDMDPAGLGLAYLFSDHAVLIREPDTVLTRAMRDQCPSVAVELGPVDDPRSDERAYDYIKRCLELAEIPAPDASSLAMYRTRARVHVADGAEFSFAGDSVVTPLVLTSGVEGVNFHSLPAGTEFGATRLPLDEALKVLDDDHRDVTHEFFELVDDRVLLKQAVTPSMYTTDPLVIRQDCLCYFMETLRLE